MALFIIVVGIYCTLIGGIHLLGAQQLKVHTERSKQILARLYWLTTASVCLPILVYAFIPRVSLSDNLMPAFAFLFVGSGIVAGVYARVGKWRGALLAHAVAVGILTPIIINGFWVEGGLPRPIYQQYPFSIKLESVEYEQANWTWKGYTEPKSYLSARLYKAYWGFDYYVGDVFLNYPSVVADTSSSVAEAVEVAFWKRVQFLAITPDESKGELRVLFPAPLGRYNAFTGRVNPEVERTLPFGVAKSPAQHQPPL